MIHTEDFSGNVLPEGFYWFNPPERFNLGAGLEIATDAETDFWQGTHYGFRRDDGHCLLTRHSGDFSLFSQVSFDPQSKYDQCGLIVRVDAENWIKVSTEYEDQSVSRLGSVVTNLGYSDWATQDVSSTCKEIWYRISRRGGDFLLEFSEDGETWQQLRITHLHKCPDELEIGVYACSPIRADFRCTFKQLTIEENKWVNSA